jgi:hypothetical protein
MQMINNSVGMAPLLAEQAASVPKVDVVQVFHDRTFFFIPFEGLLE